MVSVLLIPPSKGPFLVYIIMLRKVLFPRAYSSDCGTANITVLWTWMAPPVSLPRKLRLMVFEPVSANLLYKSIIYK